MTVQNTNTTTTDHWSPSLYQTNANFVPLMVDSIVSLLTPQPNETIFDLGCGDGILTRKLATDYGVAQVVGTDASPAMIAGAKEEAKKFNVPEDKLELAVWDGQELENSPWAGKGFDAVFSNAAIHWMKRDPEAVIRGAHAILKPGGRFVGEFGGHLNVLSVHSALIAALRRRRHDGIALSPWFFPTDNQYQQMLESNGFTVKFIALVPRQTPLPTDIGGWVDTFGGPFMAPLRAEERKTVREEVVEQLRPVLCDFEGKWTADYVRLRFVAIKN
ncbi:hypothetical protein HK097_000557 [Rhizophlyctis rosea]|uniref:Methyltransferase domain-containing protein n=1 Tax=Rhizophlyctis rosea TaxID=64517 RepID=A0AAD5SL23_9FUNG|nr:hypothetical protein HK097_000557 [Rhizophlyctis rosea]